MKNTLTKAVEISCGDTFVNNDRIIHFPQNNWELFCDLTLDF